MWQILINEVIEYENKQELGQVQIPGLLLVKTIKSRKTSTKKISLLLHSVENIYIPILI